MGIISGGGGGGGGLPPKASVYSGGIVSIDNNAVQRLSWTVEAGDSLLDITTNPLMPTVLAAGYYLVSAWVKSNPLTAGGYYNADLILDVAAGLAEIETDSTLDNTGLGVSVCVSASAFIPLGHAIELFVNSYDGAAARNFGLINATVLMLSG